MQLEQIKSQSEEVKISLLKSVIKDYFINKDTSKINFEIWLKNLRFIAMYRVYNNQGFKKLGVENEFKKSMVKLRIANRYQTINNKPIYVNVYLADNVYYEKISEVNYYLELVN